MSSLRLPWTHRTIVPLLPIIGVFAALTLLVAAVGPLATSDGPVHLNFARLWWSGPMGPLQDQFFTAGEMLVPNMLVYVVAGPLVAAIGSDAAEMVVQLLCLIALPLATLTLRFPDRRARNLAVVLMAVLSVNQMFFMGLYNYALSLGAAVTALSLTMRASARAGNLAWAGAAVALVAAYFAHAAGLLAGLCFVGAWVAPAVISDLRGGARLGAVARRWAPAALAVLPAVTLMLAFATAQQSSPSIYGINLQGRIGQLLRLDIIGVHGTASRIAAGMLSLTVFALGVAAAIARGRAWRSDPGSRLDTIRYVLLLGGTLALVLGFPDVAGGGWTHVRRMMPLPVIAAIVMITAGSLPRWGDVITTVVAALLAVLLVAAYLEQSSIAKTIRQSDRLLARVPDGCTILPLVPEPRRTASDRGPIQYSPFIHVANRAEMRGDRVVLYNYLARLGVYPVSVAPGHETQALLFDWQPAERDPRIFKVDIGRFEAVSGARVDYVLLQRGVARQPAGVREVLSQFRPVANASEFVLLRRAEPPAARRSWCPRPESNRHIREDEGF